MLLRFVINTYIGKFLVDVSVAAPIVPLLVPLLHTNSTGHTFNTMSYEYSWVVKYWQYKFRTAVADIQSVLSTTHFCFPLSMMNGSLLHLNFGVYLIIFAKESIFG